MTNDEIRKIVREEILAALSDFFLEKRLSEMEGDIQRKRHPEGLAWPLGYQIDRLSLYTDRLAFLSMKFEDWDSDKCRYNADDIEAIKRKTDNL